MRVDKTYVLVPHQEAVRQGYHVFYTLNVLPIGVKIVMVYSQSIALLMAATVMIIFGELAKFTRDASETYLYTSPPKNTLRNAYQMY